MTDAFQLLNNAFFILVFPNNLKLLLFVIRTWTWRSIIFLYIHVAKMVSPVVNRNIYLLGAKERERLGRRQSYNARIIINVLPQCWGGGRGGGNPRGIWQFWEWKCRISLPWMFISGQILLKLPINLYNRCIYNGFVLSFEVLTQGTLG